MRIHHMTPLALAAGLLLGLTAAPRTAPGAAPGMAPATPVADNDNRDGDHRTSQHGWSSLITPAQVYDQLLDPRLLIIDVRPADQYAQGHIPGAISIPGDDWRTPSVKPGEGDSQYIFRTADNEVDIARYEDLLSRHGVRNDHRIVIYGNHGGKATGSIPAMILDILGHDDVAFLDGVGVQQWLDYGLSLSRDTETLPHSRYTATDARPARVWNLDDVLANLDNADVVFHDTRSIDEYEGRNLRSNAYGGRIPGARLLDYASFFNGDRKCCVDPERAKQLLEQAGITPDKTVVLYCQTSTRVSLPYLVMKDLGYPNVVVYDASWHEYGNRDDVPIEHKTARR